MTDTSAARTFTRRSSLRGRVREIVEYRELLANLVRKELRVQYKSSVLGFFWSLLNPTMYLVVFYVVFSLILGSGIPRFPIYLLSGLLVWNLFSVGFQTAAGSIVSNAGIVNKVWFPREVLPLASVGAALVHLGLQFMVLIAALAAFRHPVDWAYLPLLPLALVTLVVVLCAFALLASAANVYLRDIEHLVSNVLLAWFWATPIVYAYDLVADKLGGWSSLTLINPLTSIVLVFQRAIYGEYAGVVHSFPYGWYVRNLLIVLAAGIVLLFAALSLFRRLESNFSEEL